MPYRSRDLLQTWLDDFMFEHDLANLVRVVPQDGSDGADTGLLVFPLAGGRTTVAIEPIAVGDQRWQIHFEPREKEAVLSSADVHAAAAELEMAAVLCDYIEAKSAAYMAALPRR